MPAKKPTAVKARKVKEEKKPEQSLALAQHQTHIAVQKAEAVVIHDQKSYEDASTLLGAIKTVQKFVKQESAKILDPLRESKRQAQLAMDAENARWAPTLQGSQAAETIVKGKMSAYITQVEEERRVKEQKIQADLAAGKIKKEETAVRHMEALPSAPTTNATAQVKKVRKVYVTDESLIPRAYFDINMGRVRTDALSGLLQDGVEVRLENDIAGFSR